MPNGISSLQTASRLPIGPQPPKSTDEHDLFRNKFVNLSDQREELVRLAQPINWLAFANEWSLQFVSATGRLHCPRGWWPLAVPQACLRADEYTVARWSENPYWQHFSGERYL